MVVEHSRLYKYILLSQQAEQTRKQQLIKDIRLLTVKELVTLREQY